MNIPLHLSQPDADALAQLLSLRADAPLELDDARELLDSLADLRDADQGGPARAPDEAGLLFQTIQIGGVELHSPTLAARIALRRWDHYPAPDSWLDDIQDYTVLGAAWILAHGRDPKALARFQPSSAQSIIEDWAQTLTCTRAQLSLALAQLTAFGYPLLAEKKKPSPPPTPASPPSSPPSPKPSPAPAPTTGCTKSPKATCTGSARPPQPPRRPATPPSTPSASVPTIPASPPASAGSASGAV